jgi:hypothetical protein
VTVRAADNSTARRFGCFIFGARMTDNAVYFGTTKYLCQSALGCSSANVTTGWRGENTMVLSAPAGLSGTDTVNHGITCDVPSDSTIFYTESSVTPN